MKWVRDGRKAKNTPEISADDPVFIESKLIKEHLRHGGHLHVRRSLNQYYYDSQIKTDGSGNGEDVYEFTRTLDRDQVVYKYTDRHALAGRSKKTGKEIEKKKHVMIMVDQLWLWVLNVNEEGRIRMTTLSTILNQITECHSHGCHELSNSVQRRSQ